jgi:hypothetical protein
LLDFDAFLTGLVKVAILLIRRQMGVERAALVGVQVVLYEFDYLSVKELKAEKLHKVGVLPGRSSVIHFGPTPTRVGFEGHQEGARAVLAVVVVFAFRFTGLHWHGNDDVPNQKARALVKAHQWTLRVIGSGVERQDMLHLPQKLGVDLAQTPLPFEVRS